VVVAADDADDPAADQLPRFSRRRRRRRDEAGSGTAPLSMTWPNGCALNWEERERVGRAALERYSPATSARGIEARPQRHALLSCCHRSPFRFVIS